jgi:archaeosine synthase
MIMELQITERDGAARIGTLTFKNHKYQTPNLLYDKNLNLNIEKQKLLTLKIGANIFFHIQKKTTDQTIIENYLSLPSDLPIETYKNAYKIVLEKGPITVIPPDYSFIKNHRFSSKTKMVIVSYASQLLKRQTYASKYLIFLKKKLPLETVIYLPAVATPSNLAFLCYLGVDLFDFNKARLAGIHGKMLFPEGVYYHMDLKSNPCMCPTCNSKDVHDLTSADIENHNSYLLFSELKHIYHAISKGSLRELVEMRVRSSPQLAAMLHIVDKNHYDFFDKVTPLYRKIGISASSSDSLWRPEVQRFQNRVCEWFEKPLSSKVLLLLPCSARKPYSASKTHKRIFSYLRNVKNFRRIHEIIVTSPLGIVPRELENIFPASSYDISVTGMWSKDEQFLIRSLLERYLERNVYDHVIIHLPPSMADFIEDLFSVWSISCVDVVTSEESLKMLVEIADEKCQSYSPVLMDQLRWEKIRSLLTYQFGADIADKLLENCTVKGRGPQYKIFRDGIQLGMVSFPRGYVSLTMSGADVLFKNKKFWVKIDDSFELKGSVFAPGVIEADDAIRIGDDVCIVQNSRLIGVGVAQMFGEEMVNLGYGEAVKIRHHVGI